MPVLPSVVHDERDRAFLVELNEFIRCELCLVDRCDSQQYYAVYKQVFSKVSTPQHKHSTCLEYTVSSVIAPKQRLKL